MQWRSATTPARAAPRARKIATKTMSLNTKTGHQNISGEADVSVSKGELDFSDETLAPIRDNVKLKTHDHDWMALTYVPKSNKRLLGSGTGGLSDIHDELSGVSVDSITPQEHNDRVL
jgi:hypothetical protein